MQSVLIHQFHVLVLQLNTTVIFSKIIAPSPRRHPIGCKLKLNYFFLVSLYLSLQVGQSFLLLLVGPSELIDFLFLKVLNHALPSISLAAFHQLILE